MRRDDHSAINVQFFTANAGGTHDSVERLGPDMINAAATPIPGNFVPETVRGQDTRASRGGSRHFDPQGARIGILLEKGEAVGTTPYPMCCTRTVKSQH